MALESTGPAIAVAEALTLPDNLHDNIWLENNLFEETALESKRVEEMFQHKGEEKKIPEKLTGILNHIEQVALVSEMLVGAIDEKRFPGETLTEKRAAKDEAIKEARRQGLNHDRGRIDDLQVLDTPLYHANAHPINGRKRLIDMGYPAQSREVKIATQHHGWGLGMKGTDTDLTDVAFDEGRGPNAVIEMYLAQYGIAGMATVIADVSKAYTNTMQRDLSVISPLTKELAAELINRQIAKGSFQVNDETWKLETKGVECVLAMITYMENKYGIDYVSVVNAAKTKWDTTEDNRLRELWTKHRALVSESNQTNSAPAILVTT